MHALSHTIVHWVLEFVFITVIWGGLKDLFVDWLFARFKGALMKTERQAAIWVHYQERAKKTGHRPLRVKACEEGKCALI